MDSGNIVNIATASMNEHPEGRKTVLNTPLTQFTDLTLSKQFIESFDLDENGEMTAGDELSYPNSRREYGQCDVGQCGDHRRHPCAK